MISFNSHEIKNYYIVITRLEKNMSLQEKGGCDKIAVEKGRPSTGLVLTGKHQSDGDLTLR